MILLFVKGSENHIGVEFLFSLFAACGFYFIYFGRKSDFISSKITVCRLNKGLEIFEIVL